MISRPSLPRAARRPVRPVLSGRVLFWAGFALGLNFAALVTVVAG